MNKVYSIIVTYNGEKWIRKCLDSIKNDRNITHTIVVDNDSNDNTVDIIEKEYPFVILIKYDRNLGFGKGNNIGINKALKEGADYILLLNQDAWLLKDAVDKLILCSKNHSKTGIFAPVNLAENEHDLEKGYEKLLGPENCPGFLNDLYKGAIKEYYKVTRYINASCWLIPSSFLLHVGGFDPLFDHYGEDVDLCQRAHYHGYAILVCTGSKIVHARKHHQNTCNKKYFDNKKMIKNHWNNYLLLKLKNLEANFCLIYFKSLFHLLGQLFYSLLRVNFKSFGVYFFLLVTLNTSICQLIKSRSICKKDSAFLNI